MGTRGLTAVAVAAFASVVLTSCQTNSSPNSLHTHTIVTEIPPSYQRSAFGVGWPRALGEHCTVRQVILARDAGANAQDNGDGCDDAGPIMDLYTGLIITPQQAQIDHVYSLEQAWIAGAWRWTPAQRHAFYIDQSNLRAVSAKGNESKSSKGPSDWRPPSESGWCVYATTWRATADKWHLLVTEKDAAAVIDMRKKCKDSSR
jgi:hypothetical protein